MENKHIDLLIKEAPSDVPGIVAYASTFDRIPDAYGDVVRKGAFAKSIRAIKDSGNNLPLLYGHVMDDPANIIGTVTDLKEDDHGLLIKADFDMENPMAQQVHRSVLAKAITKLSFAFSVLDEAPVELEDGTKANELRELEIYEVSLVVVPANPRAQVIAAKEGEPEMKMSEEVLAVDTETEPETEAKTEEPDGAKAEEPMVEEQVEETTETKNSNQERENQMENIIETIGASAPVAEKSARDILAETFCGKGYADGSRFSAKTPEIKAATWMGTPTINDYSRDVARGTHAMGVADAFQTIALQGNTYVYVPLTAKEGSFGLTAEGAQKPLVDYNKTPVPMALNTYAGIIKLSNQVMEDADWLASEIETQGVDDLNYTLEGVAMTAISGASGIGSYTATSDLVDDIIKAAAQAFIACGRRPDVIFVNPSDLAAAKVAARQLPGNSYIGDGEIDNIEVIESAQVASGTAYVGRRMYLKKPVKGGVRVDIANQNEDDFVKNLVAVRIEQRCAFVLTFPAAFVKIA